MDGFEHFQDVENKVQTADEENIASWGSSRRGEERGAQVMGGWAGKCRKHSSRRASWSVNIMKSDYTCEFEK